MIEIGYPDVCNISRLQDEHMRLNAEDMVCTGYYKMKRGNWIIRLTDLGVNGLLHTRVREVPRKRTLWLPSTDQLLTLIMGRGLYNFAMSYAVMPSMSPVMRALKSIDHFITTHSNAIPYYHGSQHNGMIDLTHIQDQRMPFLFYYVYHRWGYVFNPFKYRWEYPMDNGTFTLVDKHLPLDVEPNQTHNRRYTIDNARRPMETNPSSSATSWLSLIRD